MRDMARPRTIVSPRPILVRFDGALVDALDAWVEEIARTLPPGATITRTELIRATMQAAVDARRRGSIVTPSK